MEDGMVFVLHTQWLEPLSAGCNVGDMYVVTGDGYENLSRRHAGGPGVSTTLCIKTSTDLRTYSRQLRWQGSFEVNT
jgi:hypothetical protein